MIFRVVIGAWQLCNSVSMIVQNTYYVIKAMLWCESANLKKAMITHHRPMRTLGWCCHAPITTMEIRAKYKARFVNAASALISGFLMSSQDDLLHWIAEVNKMQYFPIIHTFICPFPWFLVSKSNFWTILFDFFLYLILGT